jgi:hypothetical protein
VPSNKTPEKLIFHNEAELMKKLNEKIDPIEVGKYYIRYVDQESLDQYKHYFDTLAHETY